MSFPEVVFRFHAVRRMFERKITEPEIIEVLKAGKVIEDYPEDQPYPSCLILGFVNGRPLHVVVADAQDAQETIVITVYGPNQDTWEAGLK